MRLSGRGPTSWQRHRSTDGPEAAQEPHLCLDLKRSVDSPTKILKKLESEAEKGT